MLSHIASDLHQAYLEEVFKPQLGKKTSTPEKPTATADLDGDGDVDSFEKKVRQFIYDVRHLMRKDNIPVERAFQIRSSSTKKYGADVVKAAKEKLKIVSGGSSSAPTPVAEESSERMVTVTINYKNGTVDRRNVPYSEVSSLRSKPTIRSVEVSSNKVSYPGAGEKYEKKYGKGGKNTVGDRDRDGVKEPDSHEYAGVRDTAIKKAINKRSKNKLKSYGVSEGFSNWRQDLKEINGVDDEISSRKEKQIKEKNIDNYKNKTVVINPEVTEQTNFDIIESFELSEEYLTETVNIATEFFYNCGLNENGVQIVIEEIGEEKFAEFVFDLTEEYFLSEARAARRRKPKESVEEIKRKIDAKEATRKKITASKAKEETEKAKETQAPSSEKSSEGTKKGIAGRVGAALGAVVKKGREDIKRVQDAAQTARDVATRRGAEAAAVYSAARELGRKAEKSATATRARRKATVTARRVAQATGRTAVKAAGAAGAAAGEGLKAHRQGKTGAQVAGRAAGTFVRKMTREELELQEKAESEQQQKLFGLALSVKRGQTPRSEASPEVLKIVDSMSEKKIRDFAKTPHSEVPKKKISESIANPQGTSDKKSPLITKIQKLITQKQVQNSADKLGENLEPRTSKQMSAQKQLIKAQVAVSAADQQALQDKKKKQLETQNTQSQA